MPLSKPGTDRRKKELRGVTLHRNFEIASAILAPLLAVYFMTEVRILITDQSKSIAPIINGPSAEVMNGYWMWIELDPGNCSTHLAPISILGV
jgi:hypothetical protein